MDSLHARRVTAREIAEALNYTPDYFSRLVPDFIATHGMPMPLPASRRRPRLWSRAAIERWLDGYADAARQAAPASLPAPVEADRRRLHLAYVNDNTGEAAEARA